MKSAMPFAALAAATVLSGCGSDPAPEPTEQIVVREPGEAAATPPTETDQGNETLAEGKAAFAVCTACHNANKDGANMAGPNLYGVVGRAAGAVEGFTYSDALKSSGITWTAAELDSYIANPATKVPGTTMVAGAVSNPSKRKAIIAYIEDASRN